MKVPGFIKQFSTPYDSEEPSENNEAAEEAEEYSTRQTDTGTRKQSGKIVNLPNSAQLQVVLVKPDQYEDCREIADHLLEKRTVVLNLEATNRDVARRLLDFVSGAAYSQEGKLKKASANTFIITPKGVDLIGDLMDEMESNGLYF